MTKLEIISILCNVKCKLHCFIFFMSKKARASNCVCLSCSESVSELNEALPLLRQSNNVKKSCAMLGRIYLRIPNVKQNS